MPKRLFSAAEIRTWKGRGETRIELAPDDLVTPEAVDVAKDLGVALMRLEKDPLEAHVRAVVKAMSAGMLDRRPTAARGAKVRVVRGNQVQLEPLGVDVKRPSMNIRTKDVVTGSDGSPMGAGLMSFEEGSFAWTLKYDEIDYVIEGELEIRVQDESYVGHAGDVIFIPRGTSIFFCTPTRCRFLYVTFPADWSAQ
jgi:ethanolamine utilization protein EutQ